MKDRTSTMRILAAALGAALLACAPARAADSPITPGGELSLDEAIQIALRYHPRHLEAASESSAANEEVGVAHSNLLPQVLGVSEYLGATHNAIGNTSYLTFAGLPRISGTNHGAPAGVSQGFVPDNNYLAGVSVSQYLYDFGHTRGLIDERKAEFAEARAKQRVTDLELAYEVSKAYFGLLASGQNVNVYQKAVDQRQEHLHEAQVYARADLRPEMDVYLTKADMARAQLELVQARNGFDDAKVALDNAMGLTDTAPAYHLRDQMGYEQITVSLKDLLDQASRQRPDLVMLRDDANAAGAKIVQARSAYFPSAFATGAYSAMGTGSPANNNYDLGIVLSWPLFNGFATEHQVAEARYQEKAIQHSIEDLEQRVILEVKSAYLNWEASREAINRARDALDAARVALSLAEGRYRNGLGNVVELDDAQRQYTDASASYVESLYGFAVAKAAVNYSTGEAPGSSWR
jgi:outer membrane protein